jgi:hypothetical protein
MQHFSFTPQTVLEREGKYVCQVNLDGVVCQTTSQWLLVPTPNNDSDTDSNDNKAVQVKKDKQLMSMKVINHSMK